METTAASTGKPKDGKPEPTPEQLERSQKRKSRREEIKKRDAQVLQLRLAGADYDMIADVLGFANRSGPWKIVQKHLEKAIRESAAEIIDIDLARCDYMLRQLWPMIFNDSAKPQQQPILGAFDRIVRIMQHRAKLLRLDQPVE